MELFDALFNPKRDDASDYKVERAQKRMQRNFDELAGEGEVVEREPRPIRIHDIQVLEASGNRLLLRVHCSKGTYIRTLVEDIARAAGTVAHSASLHRETVGDLDPKDMLDLPAAEKLAESGVDALRASLLPTDVALKSWPERHVAEDVVERFTGGQAVPSIEAERTEEGLVRVYSAKGRFLGVGEAGRDGQLAPRRIFRLGD